LPEVGEIDARVWATVEREVTDPVLLSHVLEVERQRTSERRNWADDAKAAREWL
jgi:hypothetical protein